MTARPSFVLGVEIFGLSAPGQTIMAAASVCAGAGRMNIFAVATCGGFGGGGPAAAEREQLSP